MKKQNKTVLHINDTILLILLIIGFFADWTVKHLLLIYFYVFLAQIGLLLILVIFGVIAGLATAYKAKKNSDKAQETAQELMKDYKDEFEADFAKRQKEFEEEFLGDNLFK